MSKTIHRGEALRSLIDDINPNRKRLIGALDINSKTLYNYYKYPDLPWPTIAKIVKALKKDYTNFNEKKYFTDMPDSVALQIDTDEDNNIHFIRRLEAELKLEKEKYISALEREATIMRRSLLDGVPQLLEQLQLQNKLLKQLVNNTGK